MIGGGGTEIRTWRARWDRLPGLTRAAAVVGIVLAGVALVLLPAALAEQNEAGVLADRGVTAIATRIRVHVSDRNRGPQFDAVEVTFATRDGRSVTTELAGVVGYGTDAPFGWRDVDDWPGYEQPLRVRYDPADPTFAMAEDDFRFERDYPFVIFDLVLLVLGIGMVAPAALAFRRGDASSIPALKPLRDTRRMMGT